LPLYVFCGEQMLAAYLRPSKIDGAKHAAAILKLLVTRLRQVWPSVRIIFRADSGFCRQKILNWCDRKQVQYVIGLARNKRLQGMVAEVEAEMNAAFEDTGIKQRRLVELVYGARTSCQHFNANQFRILLSALAYTLVERLRALALKDTPLANAQIHNLRNQLLKLAAVITRNTRRIRLYLASHWPSASIFKTALHALNSG
jgi:hypothetical protein